jgi:hypothetical protein
LASDFIKNSNKYVFYTKKVFICSIFRTIRPSPLERPVETQDLGIAADVCNKTQHIHAPLWSVWVPVHGEAQ